MAIIKLVADSGATKAEWRLINDRKRTIITQGISPYFLDTSQIQDLLMKELVPKIGSVKIDEIFYYGTGCANPANARLVKKAIQLVFINARKVEVTHDLMAAARSVCGKNKGVVANLGTGSFCCYYDGKKIVKEIPGIGYILGDEGSGASLGKKVIQYYLYETFDEDLRARFNAKYITNRSEILENVYKKSFPNRYLASFAIFLAENRGHYMIENIIEDGLNDFFFYHLCKFRESWTMPIHFVGSVAFGFKDVLKQLCESYGFELGRIIKNPMEGLVNFHT